MRTRFTSAPFVGVVLCSPTRYKIFLGANLTNTFLNVGDGDSQGDDFCELVGGLEMNAKFPGDYTNASEMTGYARNTQGEEFSILSIGGFSGWRCNSWYECGVQIPGPTEPVCMSATPSCWYAYNVSLDSSFSGCNSGQILVRKTNYTFAPFLAVQLCNSTRYKLFLSSSLGSQFMNIGDGSGFKGEDHCELVGGSVLNANTAGDSTLSPAVSGFYRNSEGQQFSYGTIGYKQSTYHFTSFLECGISIPGDNNVVY
uniref:LOW QUALITY PROTEIN: target of Nesh-SH3-like n=1 Tax=Crassostrea virginica TaxID=6565 RepID=A0A8B8CNC5_CRAVI|nr:LOW QUALITY PROTEIN: target of Nesh-SH3-like [Crassostrea virginica]